jgi:hypothetical protein
MNYQVSEALANLLEALTGLVKEEPPGAELAERRPSAHSHDYLI